MSPFEYIIISHVKLKKIVIVATFGAKFLDAISKSKACNSEHNLSLTTSKGFLIGTLVK